MLSVCNKNSTVKNCYFFYYTSLGKYDKNFLHKHEIYCYSTKTRNFFKAEKVSTTNLLTSHGVIFLNNQQIHHS